MFCLVALDANSEAHGFVYDKGNYTSVDFPAALAGSTLLSGLNNLGQILGAYSDGGFNTHSFAYQNGVVQAGLGGKSTHGGPSGTTKSFEATKFKLVSVSPARPQPSRYL
jgi:probable HAF family extracellular repeat protein